MRKRVKEREEGWREIERQRQREREKVYILW